APGRAVVGSNPAVSDNNTLGRAGCNRKLAPGERQERGRHLWDGAGQPPAVSSLRGSPPTLSDIFVKLGEPPRIDSARPIGTNYGSELLRPTRRSVSVSLKVRHMLKLFACIGRRSTSPVSGAAVQQPPLLPGVFKLRPPVAYLPHTPRERKRQNLLLWVRPQLEALFLASRCGIIRCRRPPGWGSPGLFNRSGQVSCDVPSLCLSVHLHAPWAAPACKRGAVLGDCAALGETHGFWPQAQAPGAPTWASAGLAVFWAGTSGGAKALHKYVGCPHTRRAGGRRPSCRQTWVHQ
ncbi:Furin, partial [Takifugu flavidus]